MKNFAGQVKVEQTFPLNPEIEQYFNFLASKPDWVFELEESKIKRFFGKIFKKNWGVRRIEIGTLEKAEINQQGDNIIMRLEFKGKRS